MIEDVERIMRASRIDIGGVEYITDDRDGQRYYYDTNALSNFVADGKNVIGFDPFVTAGGLAGGGADFSVGDGG